MLVIKVAWYVLRVKNVHPGSPSDPSGTAAAKVKLRYIYLILKLSTHLGFASVAPVILRSEGDPGCTFFTLNTY